MIDPSPAVCGARFFSRLLEHFQSRKGITTARGRLRDVDHDQRPRFRAPNNSRRLFLLRGDVMGRAYLVPQAVRSENGLLRSEQRFASDYPSPPPQAQ